MNELVQLARSLGFRFKSADLMVRRDGAALLLGRAGDFAFRRPDGSFDQCRAQFCSYHRMEPFQFAVAILKQEFDV